MIEIAIATEDALSEALLETLVQIGSALASEDAQL